jgi:hypothetical protein
MSRPRTEEYFAAGKPDMLRSFSLKFDRVVEGDINFHFFVQRRLVCSILKSHFSAKQQEFFSGISDPIEVKYYELVE